MTILRCVELSSGQEVDACQDWHVEEMTQNLETDSSWDTVISDALRRKGMQGTVARFCPNEV